MFSVTFKNLINKPFSTYLSYKYQPRRFLNLLGCNGTGDPFKTKIVRKKKIEDINKPKFLFMEEYEKLAWPTWRTQREVKKSYVVSKYYPTRLNLLNIFRYKSLPTALREETLETVLKDLPRKSAWRKLKHLCIVTGRPRGRVMTHRVSRFVYRQLADYNKLSGIIKAKW